MVTYLPNRVHDEAIEQNFEFIESWAVFKQRPVPVLTGAKAGNTALASLVSLLAEMGVFVDATT